MRSRPGLIWSLVLIAALAATSLFEGVESILATIGQEVVLLGLLGGTLFLAYQGPPDAEKSEGEDAGEP